jgi:hypothetical protein
MHMRMRSKQTVPGLLIGPQVCLYKSAFGVCMANGEQMVSDALWLQAIMAPDQLPQAAAG